MKIKTSHWFLVKSPLAVLRRTMMKGRTFKGSSQVSRNPKCTSRLLLIWAYLWAIQWKTSIKSRIVSKIIKMSLMMKSSRSKVTLHHRYPTAFSNSILMNPLSSKWNSYKTVEICQNIEINQSYTDKFPSPKRMTPQSRVKEKIRTEVKMLTPSRTEMMTKITRE